MFPFGFFLVHSWAPNMDGFLFGVFLVQTWAPKFGWFSVWFPCKPTPGVPSKQNTHKQPLVCRLTQADQRWRKMEDPESGEEANPHVAVQEAKVLDFHLVNNICLFSPVFFFLQMEVDTFSPVQGKAKGHPHHFECPPILTRPLAPRRLETRARAPPFGCGGLRPGTCERALKHWLAGLCFGFGPPKIMGFTFKTHQK